jgi:hypothetical protein
MSVLLNWLGHGCHREQAMRLTAKFQVPRVNFNRYRQALHENLSESLAQAAAQWLHATATEIVPVWSAASRATFSPLASYVGYVLSLAPEGDAPNRVQLGLDNGNASFDVDRNTGIYRFSYSTTLPHLIINEYYNANTFVNPKTGEYYFHLTNPGPYHFQEAGERAFRQFTANIVLPGWHHILEIMQLRTG